MTARTGSVFQILGLDHVVLRVKDISRMTRFYCDVLGCSVERERLETGLMQLRAGAALIDLKQDGAVTVKENVNMDHLCLRIEPFDHDVLVAHLASNGVVPMKITSNYGADGYGPSLKISDPEGNVVELKGPSTRAGK